MPEEERTKGKGHRAHVASRTRGRIRIRLHKNPGRTEVLQRIKENLSGRTGIHEVATNETTGSVSIRYSPQIHDEPGIRRVLEDLDVIFSEYGAGPGFAETAGDGGKVFAFASAVEDLNSRLSAFAGLGIDLKDLLPAGLLGVGIWSIARNGLRLAQVPGWVFVWLALDTYLKLHPSDKAPSEIAPPGE